MSRWRRVALLLKPSSLILLQVDRTYSVKTVLGISVWVVAIAMNSDKSTSLLHYVLRVCSILDNILKICCIRCLFVCGWVIKLSCWVIILFYRPSYSVFCHHLHSTKSQNFYEN